MTTTATPMCMYCSRLSTEGWTCEAYVEGIPNALWIASADHRAPLPGDHGVRFEANSEQGAAVVKATWGDEPVPYVGPMILPDQSVDPE